MFPIHLGRTALIPFVAVCALAGADLPFPGHGTLRCDLPASWKETSRDVSNGLMRRLVFDREGKPGVSLKLTVMTFTNGGGGSEADAVRRTGDSIRESLRKSTLEPDVAVAPLEGAMGPGWWFQITVWKVRPTGGAPASADSGVSGSGRVEGPPPGSVTYLTHADLKVGTLIVSANLVMEAKDEAIVKEALAILRTCRQVQAP